MFMQRVQQAIFTTVLQMSKDSAVLDSRHLQALVNEMTWVLERHSAVDAQAADLAGFLQSTL